VQTVCLDGRPFTDPQELLAAVFALLPAAALDGLVLLDLARAEKRKRMGESSPVYATPPANGTPGR
jgi:membrane-associated protease RseP (regulator of RpoE activity)